MHCDQALNLPQAALHRLRAGGSPFAAPEPLPPAGSAESRLGANCRHFETSGCCRPQKGHYKWEGWLWVTARPASLRPTYLQNPHLVPPSKMNPLGTAP